VSPLDTKEIIPTQHTKKARRDTSTLPLQLMPCSHASSLTARFPCRTHPHSSRTGFLILQRHRHGHVRARRKLLPPEASVLRAISIRAYGMHATAASGVESARTGRVDCGLRAETPSRIPPALAVTAAETARQPQARPQEPPLLTFQDPRCVSRNSTCKTTRLARTRVSLYNPADSSLCNMTSGVPLRSKTVPETAITLTPEDPNMSSICCGHTHVSWTRWKGSRCVSRLGYPSCHP
jgi:hypothetical protein